MGVLASPCGNGILDAGEQCDPPDFEHCNTECQWICGDRVVQGPAQDEESPCDPPPEHCSIDDCGIHCGPGEEECDWPRYTGGSTYCGTDCMKYIISGPEGCAAVYGNGIIEINLPFCEDEECEDDSHCPGSYCREDCTCAELE